MDTTESPYKVVMVVEYDGTDYCGFQYQTGVATVQDELEKAIFKLTGERRRVLAASRTDAGAHAEGQVVSFRTESKYKPSVYVSGMNHFLPEDIAVKEAFRVDQGFDVRRRAIGREYEYRIANVGVRSPLSRRYSHVVRQALDSDAMNAAAQQLCGTHDLASFVSSPQDGGTVRTVRKASVCRKDRTVVFVIEASSFMPYQVRNTVGTLIKVGLGKAGKDSVGRLVESPVIGSAGPTAPARGLFLMRVNYPEPLERYCHENC